MSSFEAVWKAVESGGLPEVRSAWDRDEFAAYGLLAAVYKAQANGMRRDQFLALAADLMARPKPSRLRVAAKV